MTIDRPSSQAPMRRLAKPLAMAATLVACWLGVIAGMTFTSRPGGSVAIIGSPSRAIEAVAAANGRVLNVKGFVTIARSDDAGFVPQLYAAGALLVLDAEQAGGCTGRPPKKAAAKT